MTNRSLLCTGCNIDMYSESYHRAGGNGAQLTCARSSKTITLCIPCIQDLVAQTAHLTRSWRKERKHSSSGLPQLLQE